jgi:hypothetical protein
MSSKKQDATEPTNADLVSALGQVCDEHIHWMREIVAPGISRAEDHVVVAALRRSLALATGFVTMVGQRNRFCALPLVRLQLDSALHVFAYTLVDDAGALFQHALNGHPLHEHKDRNGRPLSDSRLHRELSKKYPIVSEFEEPPIISGVYGDTCGFVHFSRQHLFGIFDLERLRAGEMKLTDVDCLPSWDEEDVPSSPRRALATGVPHAPKGMARQKNRGETSRKGS